MKEKLAGKTLFINCANDLTKIVLFSSEKIIAEKIIESRLELSDKLLAEIDGLIQKNNFQIELVAVFPGPGSYTGLRVGLTSSNFLAWSLNIPIFEADANGKIVSDKKEYLLPVYLREAHITKPKVK